MGSESIQPIGPAFAKMARRVLLGTAVVAVMGFAVTVQQLLHTRGAAGALEQARLCAAALSPGTGGDLSDSVDRLRSRYDRLVGVATLTPSGDFQDLYIDSPGYRPAAADAADSHSYPVATTATVSGDSEPLWAVAVPLNGSSSRSAWRAVFLLRRESILETWLGVTAAFAALLALVLYTGLRMLTRWFDRQVVGPLRSLAYIEQAVGAHAEHLPVLRSCGWREIDRIAQSLLELAYRVAKNQARTRQAKYDAERQMRRRAARLDHRLRRAEEQAGIDPLTGLRNRRFLNKELEPLFQQQRAQDRDLTIIMIDLDNFKALNDTYGHEAGDEVLRFLGELLHAAIRPGDHAVRYGGDEFLLLLPGVDIQQGTCIAERIIKLFGQYMARRNSTHDLGLSAGAASLRSDPCAEGTELIKKADQALYDAKRKGKNTVSVCVGVLPE